MNKQVWARRAPVELFSIIDFGVTTAQCLLAYCTYKWVLLAYLMSGYIMPTRVDRFAAVPLTKSITAKDMNATTFLRCNCHF